MKKILVIVAIITLAPLLAAPAAEAGIFSVGVAFNVGGFFFDLGFGGPRYSAHASHHVYRVSEPLHYSGYQCHSGCYRDAGYSYHHAECPVVAHHFSSYGFSPYVTYPAFFAPRAYGSYGYYSEHRGYGSRYRYYAPRRGYRHYGHYGHRGHRGHHSQDARGPRGYRDHRGGHGRYDRHRGDRYRDRGRTYDHRDRRRHGVRDRHDARGGARHHGVDRSDRRRHEARGEDRGRGARRRDAGSTRSRGSGSRRPH